MGPRQRRQRMSQPKMYVDANGTKYWSLNDKFHREDGPAVEYVDGTKRWFFKDEEVTWQQLFRNANGDLEKECRILTYALTNG